MHLGNRDQLVQSPRQGCAWDFLRNLRRLEWEGAVMPGIKTQVREGQIVRTLKPS